MAKREQSREGAQPGREETIRDLEPSVGMTEQTIEPFTEQEIRAFAQKLQSWGDTLPEREQELLAGIVLRASRSDDDVSGYTFGMSWSSFAGQSLQTKIVEITQDVTSNPEKTRDKTLNAWKEYIRG
jgi:hypothetical protein